MHGKASAVEHNQQGMFETLPQPLFVARYHSLVALNVPACLDVIATTGDIVMSVYHATDRMLGFQFHPESILTAQGSSLLRESIRFLTKQDTAHA